MSVLSALGSVALLDGLRNMCFCVIVVRVILTPAGEPSRRVGGMKRRLSFAVSTVGDPVVLFLDEPTTDALRARVRGGGHVFMLCAVVHAWIL